ncbi:DMT family transporter [Leptolyngbya sp. CCY15150]|uniref:DMT family transporter n=1 Tax=Leptolyngbya sp. CCY15150 TaxID=2767772 RepID=UPI00195130DF|nr:DMT family transporter [Leptolyngbya sp. CCY15150]
MTLHQTSGRWQYGMILAATTMLLWGILPIALAVVLNVLDVYTITCVRFVIAFSVLAFYLKQQGQFPQGKQLRSASFKLMAIAIVFLGLNYLLFLMGLKLTSPTNVEVLMQLAPVTFGLAALVIFKERYSRLQWTGLGVMTLGLALFFHEQLQVLLQSTATYLLGNGLTVLACLTWTIYALAQKQLLRVLPSPAIMLVIYGGCALLFLPLSQLPDLLELSLFQWGMLIFCGINTLLAYGAFSESLEHLEASRVSAIISLTPLVTIASMQVAARWFPGLIAPEHISALGFVGALLVVGGSVAIALSKRMGKPEQLQS